MNELYTDGGVCGINPSPLGGAWAWRLVVDGVVRVSTSALVRPGREVPGPVTNNQTEYLAVLDALESMPDGWSGRVCSDSRVTLGRVFQRWTTKGLPEAWIARMAVARARLGPLTFRRLDGHPTRAQLAA